MHQTARVGARKSDLPLSGQFDILLALGILLGVAIRGDLPPAGTALGDPLVKDLDKLLEETKVTISDLRNATKTHSKHQSFEGAPGRLSEVVPGTFAKRPGWSVRACAVATA